MEDVSTIEKKKLCWNCEGDVARTVANCPFCGVYLHPEEEEASASEPPSEEAPPETRDVYAPPFPMEEEKEEPSVTQAPYASEATPSAPTPKATSYEGWKEIVTPLALMMAGSVFFLFSFLMLLFSHNGYFTLRWDASYWFVYLLVALPLLYFGWQSLESLEE